MRNVTIAAALLSLAACMQPQAIEVWGKAGWNTDGTEAEFRQAEAECYFMHRSIAAAAPTVYAPDDPYASGFQDGTNNGTAASMNGSGWNSYHTCMHEKGWELNGYQ